MASARTVIVGHAYQHRATLEVHGDALTWRATRGPITPVAENIVTTVHDIRDVRWVDRRWSLPGVLLALAGVLWIAGDSVAWGGAALAASTALGVWRFRHPRLFLMLELADRRLIMRVVPESAAPAGELVSRIQRTLATGEAPAAPSALP